MIYLCVFFFSSRRRHTRCSRDWSSDVCSSDLDLDLRSEDPRALAQLDVTVRAALERAADDENRRRTTGSPTLRVRIQLLGARPSGMTPRAPPPAPAAVPPNLRLGRGAGRASASAHGSRPPR